MRADDRRPPPGAQLRARVRTVEETNAALVEAVQSLMFLAEQNTENVSQLITALLRLQRDLGYIDPPPSLRLVGGPARDSSATPRPTARRPAG